MKTTVTVQFDFPRTTVLSLFDERIAGRISDDLDDIGTLTWDADDPDVREILARNDRIEGRRLIRLIRSKTVAGSDDIRECGVYELQPGAGHDSGIGLCKRPIRYYELKDVCEVCASSKWVQCRNLELKRGPRSDIDVTENEELIVVEKLRDLLSRHELSGVSFRPVHQRSDCLQMVATISVPVLKTALIQELDPCRVCGEPRTRKLEDSNGVELHARDRTETFEERTPVLEVSDMPADFGVTSLEFGTLGRRPAGAPRLNLRDFPYKSSFSKFLMSGRLAQVLCENRISGFEALPVRMDSSG